MELFFLPFATNHAFHLQWFYKTKHSHLYTRKNMSNLGLTPKNINVNVNLLINQCLKFFDVLFKYSWIKLFLYLLLKKGIGRKAKSWSLIIFGSACTASCSCFLSPFCTPVLFITIETILWFTLSDTCQVPALFSENCQSYFEAPYNFVAVITAF